MLLRDQVRQSVRDRQHPGQHELAEGDAERRP